MAGLNGDFLREGASRCPNLVTRAPARLFNQPESWFLWSNQHLAEDFSSAHTHRFSLRRGVDRGGRDDSAMACDAGYVRRGPCWLSVPLGRHNRWKERCVFFPQILLGFRSNYERTTKKDSMISLMSLFYPCWLSAEYCYLLFHLSYIFYYDYNVIGFGSSFDYQRILECFNMNREQKYFIIFCWFLPRPICWTHLMLFLE